jgi:hypothetical protein
LQHQIIDTARIYFSCSKFFIMSHPLANHPVVLTAIEAAKAAYFYSCELRFFSEKCFITIIPEKKTDAQAKLVLNKSGLQYEYNNNFSVIDLLDEFRAAQAHQADALIDIYQSDFSLT